MKWTVLILQGLLVVGFLFFGLMKLNGDSAQVQAFNDIYGYGTEFMYVVGGIEVISAVGLLLGFWKKNLVLLFSGVLSIVMVGAIFTHLSAGQGFGVASMPLAFLVLSLIVLFGQRSIMKTQTV